MLLPVILVGELVDPGSGLVDAAVHKLWGQRVPQLAPHRAALAVQLHLATDDLSTGHEGLVGLTADEGPLRGHEAAVALHHESFAGLPRFLGL